MKMKRICLFLALVLLAALTFSAFAQEDGSTPTEPAVILREQPHHRLHLDRHRGG